jgi:hypothetical protein
MATVTPTATTTASTIMAMLMGVIISGVWGVGSSSAMHKLQRKINGMDAFRSDCSWGFFGGTHKRPEREEGRET